MAAPANPLLIDPVIHHIFGYFEGDRDNLASFRLVCTTWNTAAARRVKNSLSWKIGGGLLLPGRGLETKAQTEARIRRNENSFMGVMDKCKNDLFQNFHFGPGARSDATSTSTSSRPPAFWETFGPFMRTLKLFCGNGDLEYTFSCLEYTPNLESLHLYGQPPTTDDDKLNKIRKLPLHFPQLTSLAITSIDLSNRATNSIWTMAQVGKLIIRSSSSPKLTQLYCGPNHISSGFLGTSHTEFFELGVGVDSDPEALGRLTTLKVSHEVDGADARLARHDPWMSNLNAGDINNIRERCTALRVLSLDLPQEYGSNREMQEALHRLVTDLRLQLVELSLNLNSHRDWRHATGPTFPAPPRWPLLLPQEKAFPDVPSLKKLVLFQVRLPNFNFYAPSLIYLGTPTNVTDHGAAPTMDVAPSTSQAHSGGFRFIHAERAGEEDPPQAQHQIPAQIIVDGEDSDSDSGDEAPPQQMALPSPSPPLSPEPTATAYSFENVTTLRLSEYHRLTSTNIQFLSNLFPNVRELRCALIDDEALSTLFTSMPSLKRLYLGWSRITDLGVTGLSRPTLDFIASGCFRGHPHDGQFAAKVGDSEAKKVPPGRGAWIGQLRELEHFTLETTTLSRLSVYLGFVELKELKYLRLKPFQVEGPPHLQQIPGRTGIRRPGPMPRVLARTYMAATERIETVAVRTLVDSCPVLAKLDVCGTERQVTTTGPGGLEGYRKRRLNVNPTNVTSLRLENSNDKKFGCGLTAQVIAYLRSKLPTLEIVYDEAEPLSDRIRTGKADYVRVMD